MRMEERGSEGLDFVARAAFITGVVAGFQGVMVRCVMVWFEMVKSKKRVNGSVMP